MKFSLSSHPKPIAFGRKSEIFAYDTGKVLKLYVEDFDQNLVQREFACVGAVSRGTDISLPHPYELVHLGKRWGIVFEKVDGISYMDLFQKNPLLYFTMSKELAHIHQGIHTYSVTGIPTQVETFASLLQDSPRLDTHEKHVLLSILSAPHEAKLCHGDFHHGNVIRTPTGAVILDWMDAFVGDPLLDIALTCVNAAISDAPDHVPYAYRVLYEGLKKAVALDMRMIHSYQNIDEQRLPSYMALAAGIHLVRKEGNSTHHRRYFKQALHALSIS